MSLSALAERYRRLLEHADAGVWEIDGDARTSFVNKRMCEMLGYSEEEMLGRGLFEFMDEGAREEAERNLARRREGIREQHDFRLIHKDGRTLHTLMSTSPIFGADDAYAGAIAFVTDVTGKRRDEKERAIFNERIVQTQKFESLGVLAGGFAHDFNNLLQSILGEASLALADAPPNDPAHEPYRNILESAQRAAMLTAQMLALSGRAPSTVAVRDLGSLLTEMRPLLDASVGRSGKLSVEVPLDLPSANLDGGQIKQLVLNLVSNAADAMKRRPGAIRVQVAYEEVDEPRARLMLPLGSVRPGPHLRVRVEDEGEGIDPEVLGRVFEPFFSTKEPGRGLGLSAALGIARCHGGGVEISSPASGGPRVDVLLPSTKQLDMSEETLPSDDAVHLLVIDDEPMVQRIVRITLERSGYRVSVAGSGPEAIALMDGAASDVGAILLDINLPGMRGDEVYTKLREKTAAHVIFSSGYSLEPDIRSILEEGSASFLQKPYRPAILLATIEKIL